MGLKIEKKKAQGEGSVTVQKKKMGTEVETKSATDPVETDGTLVGFRMGHTKNLGNYESARVEVSLVLPTTVDGIEQAFDACKAWADQKLTEVITEIEQEVG